MTGKKQDGRSTMHGDRFLLGMAVSALTLRPGETRSQAELAAYTDTTPSNIQNIEDRAIRKLRKKLRVEIRELRLSL